MSEKFAKFPQREKRQNSSNGKPGKQTKTVAPALSLTNLPAGLTIQKPLLAPHPGLEKLTLLDCGITSLDILGLSHVQDSLVLLNLSGNNLSAKSSWKGLEKLTKLSVLNATNCHLTEAPSQLRALKQLKALVLSHNELSSLSIPVLKQLNTLAVSHNKLTSLPQALAFCPSITKISASHNLLSSDPKSIPDLSSLSLLREVRLNDNPNITCLPAHFTKWGKSTTTPQRAGKSEHEAGHGLHLLDIKSCGFSSWLDLRPLASQTNIQNLGISGNPVITADLEESGEDETDAYESLRSKLKILLPNLKILENTRSREDVEMIKAKKQARKDEEEGKAAAEKAYKERRERSFAKGSDGERKERSFTQQEPLGERVQKKRKRDEPETELELPAESTTEDPKEKKKIKKDSKIDKKSDGKEKKSKSKSREEVSDNSKEEKPIRKRGRESKFLGTVRTPEERHQAAEKKKKSNGDSKETVEAVSSGPRLADLMGTDEVRKPKKEETTPKEPEGPVEKESSAVLKIIEAHQEKKGKKSKKKDAPTPAVEEKDNGDVFDLLGVNNGTQPELDGWD